MAVKSKRRVVAFVSDDVVRKYEKLSKRYGISRSELYRLVLQRGYKSIASWCERTYQAFEEADMMLDEDIPAEIPEARPPAVRVVSDPPESESEASTDPVSMLSDFTKVLVEQESELHPDQLKMMVRAQASVFGVGESEVDDVISGIMEQLFPEQLDELEDGSGSGDGVDLD